MFEMLERAHAPRCLMLNDPATGLRAVIALDSLVLGPAVGGVRTLAYPSDWDAVADAARLARAMTLKCAIAGLPAGGAKTVVLDHAGMNRRRAFRRLGGCIEELKGLYWCAGDLGTTADDLAAIAEATDYVASDAAILSAAAGRGVASCILACAAHRGIDHLDGLRIAIQGCGAMGGGTARILAEAGARIWLADLDREKAARLAAEVGGQVIAAEEVLEADVDILSPCAVGAVLTEDVAARVRAWAICGAANNQLASPGAGRILQEREILFVPDFLSSAGAVIAGTISLFDGSSDPSNLIARLGRTTREVLVRAEEKKLTSTEVAEELALARIAAGPVAASNAR